MQFVMLLLLLLIHAAAAAAEDIWFGTAPFCNADQRDCDIFDMEFVRTDSRGDGKRCLTGTKVLCRTKDLGRRLVDTGDTQLAVVTYNIFERPFFITHDGQTERTCHIPRALLSRLPQTDVVVFEEAFLGGCWYNNPKASLQAQLARYGFPYATDIVGSFDKDSPFFVINGGVFIASRWPILSTRTMQFSDSGHADRFSRKGAVYTSVQKGSKLYHIVGTHMQAQIGSHYDAIRVKQAAELRQFVKNLGIVAKQPVIIAGDFNCDRNNNRQNVDDVLTAMGATMPRIVGKVDATFDYKTNDVVEAGNTLREWLDFAVYSRSHLQPLAASQEAFRLTADKTVTYCNSAKLQPFYVSPWATLCHVVKETVNMSDHYPVLGRFTFE